MKDVKKSLLIITTGLTFAVAVTVFASNQQSILTSIAGGMTIDGNKRTLVLDSSTPLNIDEYNKGTLTIGNIGVYAPNCSALENGVARLTNGEIFLYCATAGLDGSNNYYGFSKAPIESLSITFKHGGTATTKSMYFYWTKLSQDFVKSTYSSPSSLEMTKTTEEQTFVLNSSNARFILYQSTPREGSYPCIYISTSEVDIDLISLTVQYSCS